MEVQQISEEATSKGGYEIHYVFKNIATLKNSQ
jgi:hypothetical protein